MALTRLNNQALPAGTVLQVKNFVETTFVDAGTTSTYTEQMTSLRPFITPISSSNKILVMTTLAMGGDVDSDSHSPVTAQFKIDMYTGSTNGSGGTLSSTLYESNDDHVDKGGQSRMRGSTITTLASPSTTSEVHFRILTRCSNSPSSRSLMLNKGIDTTVTIMEIAG